MQPCKIASVGYAYALFTRGKAVFRQAIPEW